MWTSPGSLDYIQPIATVLSALADQPILLPACAPLADHSAQDSLYGPRTFAALFGDIGRAQPALGVTLLDLGRGDL